MGCVCFFFSSRRRHTRCSRDWSSDVCSSDLVAPDERTVAYLMAYRGMSRRDAAALCRDRASDPDAEYRDRKSTRLNSSHGYISYAVFCLKKKTNTSEITDARSRARRLPFRIYHATTRSVMP